MFSPVFFLPFGSHSIDRSLEFKTSLEWLDLALLMQNFYKLFLRAKGEQSRNDHWLILELFLNSFDIIHASFLPLKLFQSWRFF